MSGRSYAGPVAAIIAIIAIATMGVLVSRRSGSEEEYAEMLLYLSVILYIVAAVIAAVVLREPGRKGAEEKARAREEKGDESDVSEIEREFAALEREIDQEEKG